MYNFQSNSTCPCPVSIDSETNHPDYWADADSDEPLYEDDTVLQEDGAGGHGPGSRRTGNATVCPSTENNGGEGHSGHIGGERQCDTPRGGGRAVWVRTAAYQQSTADPSEDGDSYAVQSSRGQGIYTGTNEANNDTAQAECQSDNQTAGTIGTVSEPAVSNAYAARVNVQRSVASTFIEQVRNVRSVTQRRIARAAASLRNVALSRRVQSQSRDTEQVSWRQPAIALDTSSSSSSSTSSESLCEMDVEVIVSGIEQGDSTVDKFKFN